MAREAAVALALLAPLLLGLASAKPPPAAAVTHLDAKGNLSVGMPGASLAPPAPSTGLEVPWHERFQLSVDDCHRRLIMHVDFEPRNVTAATPVAQASTPFELVLVLRNATTGMELEDGRQRYLVPGARALTLPGAANLTADLYLERGREVAFELRIKGWVPSEASCTWQGQLFINEVEADPPGSDWDGGEWVELYHGGLTPVDLTGWHLATEHGRQESQALDGITLSPGEHVVVAFQGQFLDNQDEVVVLLAPDGWEVDRTPALSDTGNNPHTHQRSPDGGEQWVYAVGSPGAAN